MFVPGEGEGPGRGFPEKGKPPDRDSKHPAPNTQYPTPDTRPGEHNRPQSPSNQIKPTAGKDAESGIQQQENFMLKGIVAAVLTGAILLVSAGCEVNNPPDETAPSSTTVIHDKTPVVTPGPSSSTNTSTNTTTTVPVPTESTTGSTTTTTTTPPTGTSTTKSSTTTTTSG